MEELVSIIIPIYNVELYARRCINAVINQTYTHLEVILVNDGSQDNSGSICDEYASIDSRVLVIHKKNGGLSSARNIGIEHSNGTYLSFIDADDFVDKFFIEKLLSLILENNADISICHYFEGNYNDFPNSKIKNKKNLVSSSEFLALWHSSFTKIETMAWNKLYKKELFNKIKIRYPEGRLHEDVFVTHLVIAQANLIAITSEKLYVYFKRPDSIMQTFCEEKVNDYIFAQKERISYFKDNNYNQSAERLEILLIKYYMKTYCMILNDKNFEQFEISNMLISAFEDNYREVENYKKCKFWEKVLFNIFHINSEIFVKHLYFIYNYFNSHY